MKKTLLFHISSLLAGGIETVLIELLHGLDASKYKVRLSVTYDLGELEIPKTRLPDHVEVHYILSSAQSAIQKKKISKTISLPERLYEALVMPFIKKGMLHIKLRGLVKDTDVVIDFDMTLAAYTNLFRDKKRVAYCHFILGHYWDGSRRKLHKLAKRLLRYDKVMMLCDEMKETAIALFPSLEGQLVKFYSTLDTEKIQTLAGQPLEGHEYLLEDGYFVSIGHLSESRKDFSVLIKGYAACVKKYGIKQRLVIIATGHSDPALEELAINEEVGEMIVFEDSQANLYNWMRNSSLFLFCSRYEGIPEVLLDALLLSCPVISTSAPVGVKEMLMNGKCGTLIDQGDVPALTESIYTLLNDAALQQSYRENAKEILSRFEIKNMVREFENLVAG